MGWERRKYTKEDFISAWNSSVSVGDCAKQLGLSPAGGTVDRLRKMALELGLDEKVTVYRKGVSSNKIPTEQILIENSKYNGALRPRLIAEGLLKEECSQCGIKEWQGKKAPLQLDHINGVNNDNRIENLRILCANCHALTDTYGTKNLKRKSVINTCVDCQTEIRRLSTRCNKCASIMRQGKGSTFPGKEILVDELERNSWNISKTSKTFGVSFGTIKKWMIRNDIVKPV